MRDDAAQANYVVEQVLESREGGLALKQQAVLFRSSSHSGPLEIELTRRNIPFVKYGGLRFLDAAHVKDVLAILRFVENPRDRDAGFRVLQLLPGIGPTSAGRIVETLEGATRPFRRWRRRRRRARPRAGRISSLVADLEDGRVGWPAEIERVRLWYEPVMENAYDDAAVRLLDLGQLAQIAAGYPARERFLTELTLDPPDATSDTPAAPGRDEDYLILSTIHSAKGQEWRSVHVLNVVDGCIPSDLGTGSTHELEEERRLLYVAMTRARDRLHLLVPQRFYPHQQRAGGDRHLYAQRTRFITKPMLRHFEDIYWPPLPPVEGVRASPASARIDVAAQMRALWAK